MWPCAPLRVDEATIRAALYDLGPYPAITDGNDVVRGELWRLAESDVPATLAALDEIECYGQGGVDLYVQRIVDCRLDDGNVQPAHAYFIADPAVLSRGERLKPGPSGHVQWSRRSS
jgi:gamma-glutamylcyclotransferase (GGCT)/AIG2-like uncharacterized protein YtfP